MNPVTSLQFLSGVRQLEIQQTVDLRTRAYSLFHNSKYHIFDIYFENYTKNSHRIPPSPRFIFNNNSRSYISFGSCRYIVYHA